MVPAGSGQVAPLGWAAHCDLLPFMPTGKAMPIRRIDMAPNA